MDNIWDILSIHLLINETLILATLTEVCLQHCQQALKISSENVFDDG